MKCMLVLKSFIRKHKNLKLLVLVSLLFIAFDLTGQVQLKSNSFSTAQQPPALQSFFVKPAFQTLQMPKAYSYEHLAFFCKIEVQLEENLQLPLKFRLGSVDYVNYLEQKNPYVKY